MTTPHALRRACLPIAAVALLAPAGGCGIFGIASKVGEAIESEKKVEVLAKYKGLENKTVAVIVNADRGTLYEYPTVVPQVAGNIATAIKQHVSGAQVLNWRESLAWLADQGKVTRFAEAGAGKVLTGIAKRLSPDAAAASAATPADIEAVLKTL